MTMKTPFWPPRNGVPKRLSLGFFGLVAVLAMVFAGPAHLWLIHGGSHHHHGDQAVVETTAFSGCQGHGHACGGHQGHVHHEHPASPGEDQQEPAPCDSSTDDCAACMAMGAAKPIELVDDVDLGEVRFLEIELQADQSPTNLRRLGSAAPRGPPPVA